MSKCAECPEEGLPEWIMSYADMITILMAFFVVMYSMAGAKDTVKEEAVMKSLRNQFGPLAGLMSQLGTFSPQHSKVDALNSDARPTHSDRDQDKRGQRRSPSTTSRIPAVMPGEVLAIGGVVQFEENQDQLTDENQEQLISVAQTLAGKPQRIEVRGHTSPRPLPPDSPYRDHWDLAYARSRNTMEFLVSQGVDPVRIRLGVAAQQMPAPSGAVPSGRPSTALDSRVEVIMLSEFSKQVQ